MNERKKSYFYSLTQNIMKKRLLIASAAVIILCISLTGHEFWIQPGLTHIVVGQRIPLELTIGENFTGERWQGKGNKVQAYTHYFRNESEELLLSLEPGEGIVDLPDFIPRTEGTHMLTLATHNNYIEMPANEFEDYLKEDGLMAAFNYRNDHNEKQKIGRERYRRCAKVLIQVGDDVDHTYRKETNLILDIIPLKNPYTHAKEDGLTFRVLYEGYPLPDAMVKWWRKDADSVETDFLFTSEKGDVTFSAATPGLYMISVVHMIRLNNDPGADWQSTWSSLVFGIEE